MKRNRTNTNAFLIHISAFAGLIFPFGQIITPLIAWQTLKDRSPFLDEQGKEAVNFNLSYTLYVFIISIAVGGIFMGNLFRNLNGLSDFNSISYNLNLPNVFSVLSIGSLVGIVYLVGIALVIIASLKAKDGENYSYPFSIKFIK
jgi:uncharacterized Tic20 family protein|tara:strand:- start:1021 stop:1455 length:435 start_codon:yes stop_codon:yes gene_type:complete